MHIKCHYVKFTAAHHQEEVIVHHTGRMVGMLQGTLILTSGRENVRDDFVQPKNTKKKKF